MTIHEAEQRVNNGPNDFGVFYIGTISNLNEGDDFFGLPFISCLPNATFIEDCIFQVRVNSFFTDKKDLLLYRLGPQLMKQDNIDFVPLESEHISIDSIQIMMNRIASAQAESLISEFRNTYYFNLRYADGEEERVLTGIHP